MNQDRKNFRRLFRKLKKRKVLSFDLILAEYSMRKLTNALSMELYGISLEEFDHIIPRYSCTPPQFYNWKKEG